ERAGDELPVFVVDRALAQGLAHALRYAAVDLAFDNHRIDDDPEIIDSGPGHDFRISGLRVDFHFADVTTGRESKVGRIVKGALLQARFELLTGKFVCDVSVERDVAPCCRFVGAGNAEFSVLEFDGALGSYESMGGS